MRRKIHPAFAVVDHGDKHPGLIRHVRAAGAAAADDVDIARAVGVGLPRDGVEIQPAGQTGLFPANIVRSLERYQIGHYLSHYRCAGGD
jgi:hypothetical protein